MEKENYIVKDGHPDIVTRDIFQEAHRIFDKNKSHYKIISNYHQKVDMNILHSFFVLIVVISIFQKRLGIPN